MYNRFTVIALSSLLFLVGCGQQQEYIDVQWFSFLANTVISSNSYDNLSVYVLDNSKTTSGDMLTVLYQPIDPDASSWIRITSNITTLQQTYPNINITEQSSNSFSCNEEYIEGTLVLGTIPITPEKDPLYFVQHFFIHKWIWFVFTYSSSNQKSVTSMGDNLQHTRCPSI